MKVEFGVARVDHHLAGIVVDEERHVVALGRYLDPRFASALLFPLPDDGAMEITGALGDGRGDGVRPDGESADFDQAQRSTANF